MTGGENAGSGVDPEKKKSIRRSAKKIAAEIPASGHASEVEAHLQEAFNQRIQQRDLIFKVVIGSYMVVFLWAIYVLCRRSFEKDPLTERILVGGLILQVSGFLLALIKGLFPFSSRQTRGRTNLTIRNKSPFDFM